ncbi:hypothetical protein EU527_07045 [Candidatus Thorarchaeota archaeon]|nr:MAG: hypothetical protein EU527_07045 [Candidatus Thorarchaeota archaeon]
MARDLDEVMRFLENYTLTWHHWLLILSLLKLGGSGTKAQVMPVYRKEGFSPHAIDNVFATDIEDLGEAIEVDGGIHNLSDNSTLFLTNDLRFQKFIKKHIKSVVSTFKTRTRK